MAEHKVKEGLEAGRPDRGQGEPSREPQSVRGVRGVRSLREVRDVRTDRRENAEDSGRTSVLTLKILTAK